MSQRGGGACQGRPEVPSPGVPGRKLPGVPVWKLPGRNTVVPKKVGGRGERSAMAIVGREYAQPAWNRHRLPSRPCPCSSTTLGLGPGGVSKCPNQVPTGRGTGGKSQPPHAMSVSCLSACQVCPPCCPPPLGGRGGWGKSKSRPFQSSEAGRTVLPREGKCCPCLFLSQDKLGITVRRA